MKTLITGATGLIGRHLTEVLSDAHVLTRDPDRARERLPAGRGVFGWADPQTGPPPAEAFAGVGAVVHLAGESVAEGRWTSAKKQRIRDSRVKMTRQLVEGMSACQDGPRTLICGSAIGIYGSRGDELLHEQSAPGEGFLAEVCLAWEAEARRAAEHGIRVVSLRTGIVLAEGGGALQKMLLPFKLGAGGRLGSGRQWMSWVHIDDVVGLIRHAATHAEVEGPLNAVAPNPRTNREFTKVLGRVLRRPTLFPAPGFGLRLMLGEMAGELLLASQRVAPRAALESGYAFEHPELEGALRAILDAPAPQPSAV